MKLMVTHVECYDEATEDLIFKMEAFDDVCATLEIKTVVSGDAWAELAIKVAEALELMDMGKAKE
jgi:hypothetical protein